MAALPNADPRRTLPLSPSPPLPSSKDFQGTDGPIPLSPQWLLSKPGDNRPGIDPHLSLFPISSDRQEALTGLGTDGEVHDNDKKKDVFRPSAFHDRWRDEERDSSSALRKDRGRGNIDKEIGGDVFRKMDRRNENASTKLIGELRRAPSDRWVDTGSRENSYDQRRESKWSTRWGPDDKELEAFKESKWSNSGKDNDGLREKRSAHFVNDSKENDKETDSFYRPWRSPFSQGRGRGVEISHQQSSMMNMQSPTSGHNKVGGEKAVLTLSVGRGRGNFGALVTNHHNPIGTVVDKKEGAQGSCSTIKYSRTKLLDIYRVIDFKAHKKLLDGFVEVPALTQADPLEPLAFSAPSPDEMSILRAIDKGDIISSGAAQVSKDNSIGRSSEVRQSKYGSKEELTFTLEDNKDEGVSNTKSDNVGQYESPVNDKFMASHRPYSIGQRLPMLQDNKLNVEDLNIGFSFDKGTDGDSVNQVILQEKSFGRSSSSGKTISSGDQLCDLSNNDWSDTSAADAKSKATGMRLENQILLSSPYNIGESNSHIAEDFLGGHPRDSNCNNQFSDMPNLKSLLKPAPEDLYYYYKDPQGEIQGPFSGTDLVGWFEAGYFGLDLHVRVAEASADTPFCLLGDAMPHLKVKARPPPGFNEPKQNDYNLDASGRAKITTCTSVLPSGVDEKRVMREQMQRHGSMTDAEKRFLESLMSGGNISNPQLDSHSLSEGLHRSAGNSREVIPITGLDSGVDVAYLLAQKLSIERQISLSNSYDYWPGRESASVVSKGGVVAESPTLHSKILPHTGDTSHQMFKPQNFELRTMLQATGDKSSQAVNNEVPTWSNFSDIRSMSASTLSDGNNVPGGFMNALENKAEINPHDLQFASLSGYQFPQQRYQQQSSSTPLLMNQQPVMELSAGKLPLDNMLPSVPQEPHLLSLSQYSHQSVPSHTSILDGLLKQPLHVQQQNELLLQQQQQQLQQQLHQQQQLQQQQQHLLSQMLAQTHLHFGEPSHVAVRSSSLDHHGLHHQVSEPVQLSSRFPHNFQSSCEDFSSEQFPQLPSAVASTAGLEGVPLKMPNQIFGSTELSASWAAVHFSQKSSDIQQTHPMSIPAEGGKLCKEPLSLPGQHVVSDYLGSSQEGNESIKKVVETPKAVSEVAQSITVTKATDYSTSAKVCSTSSCLGDSSEDLSLRKEQGHVDMPAIKDGITDVKMVLDKKSRKQEKTSSSERGKGTAAALNASEQLKPKVEGEESVVVGLKSADGASHEVYSELFSDLKTGNEITATSEAAPNALHIHTSGDLEKTEGTKFELGEFDSVTKSNLEAANHRAWKPAPGVKPKSLLEIQQEEQRRAQAEVTATESVTSVGHLPAYPSWTGVLANAEVKSGQDIVSPDDELVFSTSVINPRSEKSQLHDLLAEVLAKPEENVQDTSSMACLPDSAGQMDVPLALGNDFIEAKDLRKSRKKASKGKIAGSKMSSSPVFSFDVPAGSTLEKVKNSRQSQPENESQSVPPSGPSLGDFVIWKGGDQANVSPAPAWSTDSAKISNPVSLRDIQKEQEKTMKYPRQQVSVPVPPPKMQSNRTTGSGGTSWNLTGSSPSKAAVSPIKIAAQSKTKVEDDLFWGPINHSKECKQADFPALANSSSAGWKVASTKGAIPRQKSIGGGSKSVENAVSSSPASSLSSSRRKRDSATIHSEAMGFKDWCEHECLRLTGTKDTNILEYCLKQPTLEAKTVLIDYLGLLDPDHVFIDKFLNYKELLSAEVIETAFQEHGDGNPPGLYGADSHTGSRGNQDYNQDVVADGSQKGGKKKGKKGKKMSSADLGFNVVSNRIMMGEIQTIED